MDVPSTQAASDFDDYKSLRPANLPDPDYSSSPPPAVYSEPQPETTEVKTKEERSRKKVGNKMRRQEGMDF